MGNPQKWITCGRCIDQTAYFYYGVTTVTSIVIKRKGPIPTYLKVDQMEGEDLTAEILYMPMGHSRF